MIYAVVLSLASLLPDAQAHVLIEDPKNDGYVSRADAILMDDNPRIRKALKEQAIKRKLMDDDQVGLFDDGFGGAVIGLHLLRQEVREQREKKKKPVVKD